MMIVKSLIVALGMIASAPVAMAYSCTSDCGREASFRYPCPTFSNPGRRCTGRDPVRYAACETAKQADCRLVEAMVNEVEDEIRVELEPLFNSHVYGNMPEASRDDIYMGLCQAACIPAAAKVGANLGGEVGAWIGGAGGALACNRLCERSKHW